MGSGRHHIGSPDEIDDIADEITTLAAHIHAATHRLLTLIARFDRMRGWEREGHRSCAHWLAFRTGIDLGAAREKVRASRTLEDLPETSAAMARGALSFAKVRGWRLLNRKDEADLERIRHASRTLSVFPDDDGMYGVRGRLDPEVGALLLRAVEAAGDALYARETAGGAEPEATSEQRRADAMGLLAERALAAGFAGEASVGPGGGEEARSGTRAERYQVLLHVEAATLERAGEPGRSEMEDGTRVSAEPSGRFGGARRRSPRVLRELIERSEINVPAARVRRCAGGGSARTERRDPRRGTPSAHDSARDPAGAGGP